MKQIRRVDARWASGFALPTVLIVSVVLMMVLLSGLTATSSISVSIRDQYYQKLVQGAAESGVNYAKACMKKDPDATWTQLKPNTDCAGNELVNCTTSPTSSLCGIINTPQIRTTFLVDATVKSGKTIKIKVLGTMELKRTSSGATRRSASTTQYYEVTQTKDEEADRASQRYWYVGEDGSTRLDFGISGNANPTLTPYTTGPSFTEGLTVITDSTGKLLFTTNGITASDASNRVMPGSSASGGLGATGSTTQGVVAFPINGNRYMVIGNSAGSDGVAATNPGDYGILKKSIIDMDRVGSNGSIGDVEPGSIQPLNRATLNAVAGSSHAIATEPNGTENFTGQYMTAAPEAFGNGYWLVFATPGRPYFYAILFDDDGDVKKVVRSNTPDSGPVPACKLTSNNAWRAAFGTMHFNTAYNKLALSSGTNSCSTTDSTRRLPSGYNSAARDAGYIYLRSFDAGTGVIGDVYSQLGNQQWYAGMTCPQGTERHAGYSVDFSPDENYLYSTSIYPGKLYRYRITGADIANGSTSIASTTEFVGDTGIWNGSFAPAYPRGGQVRRGPNGKMYVANQGSTAISVVSNPDDPSSNGSASSCSTRAANFSYNSLTLGSGIPSGLGLPDYVTRYVPRQTLY